MKLKPTVGQAFAWWNTLSNFEDLTYDMQTTMLKQLRKIARSNKPKKLKSKQNK